MDPHIDPQFESPANSLNLALIFALRLQGFLIVMAVSAALMIKVLVKFLG